MKKMSLKALFLFVAAFLFVFSGCEETVTIDPDADTVKDQAKGAYIVSDAFAVSGNHSNNNKMISSYPDCLTPQWSSGFDTLWLTFDNCEFGGATRNGTLIVLHSGTWEQGKTFEIHFDNYSVNGETADGSISVEFVESTQLRHVFRVQAQDMTLALSDGTQISWSSDITYIKSGGFLTFLDPSDDEYTMNGSGEGINRKGEAYTTEYQNVVKLGDCKWPVSGVITITKDGDKPIEIDFDHDGNAACDNIVNVTQNGITIQVSL